MAPSADTEHFEGTSWINDEFLEEILRQKYTNENSILIVDKEIDRAVGKGENYLSIMYCVKINLRLGINNEIETIHLMIKSYPNGQYMQKMVEELRVFDRELTMYNGIMPKLYKFAEERLGENALPSFTAKSYVTSRANTLVLDDLRDYGYRMADRKKRLDLQHCRLVIANLAKLHGISAILHQTNPDIISKCDRMMWCEDNKDTVCKFIPLQLKGIVDASKNWTGMEHISAKIEERIPQIFDNFFKATKFQKDGFHVLIHGDCWVNNMLFKYSDSGEPTDMKFVDLQISQIASPDMELSYFLYANPQTEVRALHMEDLLQEYHAQLCDTMMKLGVNSEVFTYEHLKKEMKRLENFGFVYTIMLLGVMLTPSEDIIDMESLTDENVDEEGANYFDKIYATATFREAFSSILLDFDKLGIFD